MNITKQASEVRPGDILTGKYGTQERVEAVRGEGDKVWMMLARNWDRPGRFLSQCRFDATHTVTVTR